MRDSSKTRKMATPEERNKNFRIEEDEKYRRELQLLFKKLRSQAISNIEFFKDGKSANDERFYSAFTHLYEHLDKGMEPGVEYFLGMAHMFDFDYRTPANGYRSMVSIIEKCCNHIQTITRSILVNRESFLFRANHYSKELEAYVNTLGQLRACLYYLQKLVHYCKMGELFVDQEALSSEEYQTAESLMLEVELLSQETFYGRCLGFQYCESMVRPLMTVSLAMAAYSEGYERNSSLMKLASSMYGGSKYIMNPELRAEQIVNVTRSGDIKFCKAFWAIAENDFVHSVPRMVCSAVAVDKVIQIQPESFELPMKDGENYIKITPPCAHSGPAPVSTRLISSKLREGQEIWLSKSERDKSRKGYTEPIEKSNCLLIHCHGGGFVAQSSASHEVYLRTWAKDLDVPILSVDYSLAPEYPFPRQLEEVFYAYCWALKNAHLLGTTAQRVCVCGDSAGGNLSIAMALRAVAMGVRLPDGILSAYGCFLVRYTPSPARIMALMDPLLPLGLMASCLAAYSGMGHENGKLFPSEESVHSNLSSSVDTAAHATPPMSPKKQQKLQQKLERDRSSDSGGEGENVLFILPDNPKPKTYIRHQSNMSTASGDSGFHDHILSANKPAPGGGGGGDAVNAQAHDEANDVGMDIEPVGSPDSKRKTDDSAKGDSLEGTPEKRDASRAQSPDEVQSLDSVLGDSSRTGESRPDRSGMRLELSPSPPLRTDRHILSKSPSEPALKAMQRDYSYMHRTSNTSPGSGCTSPFGTPPVYAQIRHFAQSPVLTFRHMPIARNPYMSPYLAADSVLQQLCPVYFICCQLDPMLDDSIMMAKRLRGNGVDVQIDLLDGLAHGFLNFVLVSHDAKHGSNLCMQRIREILQLDRLDLRQFDIIDADDLESFGVE